MRLEKYGLAVSYSKSAEDWAGIGRIVDIVLEKFIIDGESAPGHLKHGCH